MPICSEERHITWALESTKGSRAAATRRLGVGVDRHTLNRKLNGLNGGRMGLESA